MKRTSASSYSIGKKVKGVFLDEPELRGKVVDRTSTTIFVQWEGYSSPLEYNAWQMEYIVRVNK